MPAAVVHPDVRSAATVLMLLGIPDRVIDQITGWEPDTSARMRARYLHVQDAMLKEVADAPGCLLGYGAIAIFEHAGQGLWRDVGSGCSGWSRAAVCGLGHPSAAYFEVRQDE